MIEVLKKLDDSATGRCRPDEFNRVPMSMEMKETRKVSDSPSVFPQRYEFELRLMISVNYWVDETPGAHAQARRMAEMQMARFLYSEVVDGLHETLHAISDGDRMAAMNRISALITELSR